MLVRCIRSQERKSHNRSQELGCCIGDSKRKCRVSDHRIWRCIGSGRCHVFHYKSRMFNHCRWCCRYRCHVSAEVGAERVKSDDAYDTCSIADGSGVTYSVTGEGFA